MLVVAALRWVDARALIDPMTGEVSRDPRASGAGEADRCALEHALLAAEALTARCLAVTAGPPAADGMLIDALAAGAHEVLRIDGPDPADTVADSGEITAQILADGILRGHPRPDLVVCGDHSADRGTGATPGYLAEHFAAAQSLGLVELAVRDGMLRALRRLDGGRRERLSVPLPAVCSVEPGAVRLRRATLPAMLAARRTQVPVVHVISSQGTV
ncbi:MAG: mycofactocin-associated electron transfer flavoprotein beta subunit, partial [Sciscionella sp.]